MGLEAPNPDASPSHERLPSGGHAKRAKLSLAQHPVTPLTYPVIRDDTRRIRLSGKCASDTHCVRRKGDVVKEEREAAILGTFICGC